MRTDIIKDIQDYKERHMKPNYSQLARDTMSDRRTVKKYYENPNAERSKREYRSAFDDYDQLIRDKVATRGMTFSAVYHFLVNEKGVSAKYNAFTAYCRRRKYVLGGTGKGVHVRYETAPGFQLQVDWKENITLRKRDGAKLTFNVYSATLGYSRKHLFIYSATKTEQDFIRCTNEALVRIGGAPEEILTDNMSAIVSIANCDGRSRRRKHPNILQWEKDSGIRIRLCEPRSPETKGKVESSNRFLDRIMAYDGEIDGVEDVVRAISRIQNDANDTVNPETGFAPAVLFCAKEKQAIRRLPDMSLLSSYVDGGMTQKVPQTLLVPFQGRGYSVPPEYVGRSVRILREGDLIQIYYSSKIIASHPYDAGKRMNYRTEDYAAGLAAIMPYMSGDDLDEMARRNLERMEADD